MPFLAGERLPAAKLNRTLSGESGTAVVTINSGTATGSVAVTFAQPFSTAPAVTATVNSGAGAVIGSTIRITPISTTGATILLTLSANAATTLSINVCWIAAG